MKVERITDYERFVDTKKDWNALLSRSGLNNPFLSHQWFDAWWRCFGRDSELAILFFCDESGTPGGIAPLMRSEEVLGFIASHEVTDYCDFISCEDKREEFYDSLFNFFQRNDTACSCLEFINVSAFSPTLPLLRRLAAKHDMVYEQHESEVAPLLILPGSYEEFTQSLGRKNRHELRRKIRKLETLGSIRVEEITKTEKLRSAIDEFVSLHKKSSPAKQEFWQKKGMSDFFIELAGLFSSENWVQLNMLYAGDRLIGALLNLSYGETLYFYNIAYDREYSSYSPGFFLFDHSIRQAIAGKKRMADFLRGREKYKYFFGAEDSKIYNLKLIKRVTKP